MRILSLCVSKPKVKSWIPILLFFTIIFIGKVCGYDYSEKMECVSMVPLGYPESPFVLRFSPEELQAQTIWSNSVDAVVIPRNAPSPIRIGAETLRTTLTRLEIGRANIVEIDPARKTLPWALKGKRLLVLGYPQDFALVAALAQKAGLDVSDTSLNGDGFIIKPLKQGRGKIMLIVSPVARGVLYGAYELEERTSKRGVPRIDDKFVPAVRYRNWPIHLLQDPPLDMTGRWRLNTAIVPNNITFSGTRSTFFYRSFPELECEQNKEVILADEQLMHSQFAAMTRFGGLRMMMWNPLMLPIHAKAGNTKLARLVLEEKYPGILAEPWDNPYEDRLGPHRYCLCPSHPMTQEFVKEGARELVRTFPEVEMLIIQLTDGGGELFCGCDKCKNYPYMDRVTDYTKMVIDTVHQENPRMKFIFSVGWEWLFIPIYYPEYKADPTGGLKELKRRMGSEVVAFLCPPSAPPLGDQRSWVAPDTTLLGQDIPLYVYFFYYEIWGIGIARPLSTIATHLSWVLPIDIQKLQKFTEKGQMVGGMSPDAGVEVGFWYPGIEPQKYLRNWCWAKYGEKAGEYVFHALKDTHKITEGFLLETKPAPSESISMYRWGNYLKPWATRDMNAWWQKVSGYSFMGNYDFTSLEISMPQAPIPDTLTRITQNDLNKWLNRFELSEQTAIAARSAAMLAKALEIEPNNHEIRGLHETARGTVILVDLYKEYHHALIYASLARNMAASPAQEECLNLSRAHLKKAIEDTADYKECYMPLVEQDKSMLPTKPLYIPFLSCMVREAAYLFDQEFGGESMLNQMDNIMSRGINEDTNNL